MQFEDKQTKWEDQIQNIRNQLNTKEYANPKANNLKLALVYAKKVGGTVERFEKVMITHKKKAPRLCYCYRVIW